MQRYFAIFSIFVLLFMQCSTSIAIAAESTKQNQSEFDVYAKDGSTQDMATVEVRSLASNNDSVNIRLPQGSIYSDEITQALKQETIEIIYNDNDHSLDIKWEENIQQNVSFGLVDLQNATNNVVVSGIVEDEVVKETHSFKIAEINEEDKRIAKEDVEAVKEVDRESERSEKSNEINKEVEEKDKQSAVKDAETSKELESPNEKEAKEEKKDSNITKAKQISSNNETSDSGEDLEDLNTFLSIDPVFETALSGADANFKLTLKLTGSKRTYKNVEVVIDLPIEEYITFDDAQENLESLAINGVTPTFNNETNQLIYHFDEIKRGQMYEKIISLNTENGYILDDTSVEVDASISGEIHYTENDEKEEAQKGDVVPFDYVDSGSMLITASGALSLSKFRVNESEHEYGDSSIVARGQEVLWKLELEIPKKDRGQLFLNPTEKITVTDTLPAELEYVEMHAGDEPKSVDNQTLTWEFDVDDFDTQAEKGNDLFSTEMVIKTKVSDAAPKGELMNNAAASAMFIPEIEVSDNASRGVRVAIDDPATGNITGQVTVPTHLGPDPLANNGLGNNAIKNPRPEVTDDTILRFSHGIAPMNESFPDSDQYPQGNLGPAKNFIEFQTFYEIDQHLNLESMRAPGPFQFRPNNDYPSGEFFKEQPRYDIKARIDGSSTFQTLVEADAVIQGKVYTREELGLQPGQKVSEIKIEFLKGYMGNSNEVAPGGMHSTNTVLFEFSIDEGFTGTVENKFNVTGVNGNNERFNDREKNPNRYDNSTGSDISGPRQATVVEYNQQAEPVGRVGVKLLEDVRGVVTNGNNRMQVELVNVNNSGAPMNSPLETVVLLPPGVILHDEVNPSYINAWGDATDAASFEIMEEDYNGSGRQLVKIMWDDARITKGQSLQAELDVYISDHAPSQLLFDVYGFSGDEGLQAPSNTGGGITDTVLQIDTEDLNGNGNTEQPRLKSGNIYSLTGKYDIQTEKLIKGPNDEDFSKFTLAPFDGTVDYKLKMTNTTGKDLSSMTLIDVLPTVGDLGITDNVHRGSTFDPMLQGPIVLPTAWQDKVNVSYSTAKNPERDELTRHTDYLPGAPKLTNPEEAEAPNWMPASEVTDWSTIHSFKIELQPGDTWIKGQDIEIDFSMIMPSEADVEEEVKNIDLVPQQRAAWNSFAVATDQGHPVEPERVGVAIETFIDIPVEKVWEGEAQEEVTINLLADDVVVDTIDLSNKNDWQHIFEELPTADGANKINYTIEEVEIDGYAINITGNADDGFVVTNTELTNIFVEKVWEGTAQNEVTINLLAGNEEVESVVLSEENDWQHVFEDLPAANSVGPITYTIEEVEIDGYDTNITGNADEGFVVTNTELMNIPVKKVWEGAAQDEVTINLLADGEEAGTIVLSDENDWQHVFVNLPVASGSNTIIYTVEEVSIAGYETNITGNADDGFVVTNIEVTNIPVEKIWEGEVQDEVTINLLADGEEVDTIVLSDENDWQHIFENLPVVNGEETIAYTVEEVSIDGYDTNITGNADGGFVVTNTELMNIPVEKVWEGETLDEVTINLLADGEEVGTIVLSDENDWEHVFEDLPVAKGADTIAYTVEEVEIDGYDTSIICDAENGFIVTNTELMSIPVEKVWEGEAQDEVTINILVGDEEVDTIVLSDENDWEHVFEDLPAANSEGAIIYTVEEVAIDGYETSIIGNAEEGFVVTNTELMNIPVGKVWEGAAQDEATINLLADGEEVGTIVLSDENDWQHIFEDFPVANDEVMIVYTVEEVEIDGYKTNITGNAEDGFVVTNTELVSIPVEKVWQLYEKDKENVTINLLADSEKIDSIELSEDNDWKYTFENLPVTKGAEMIDYTIEEVEIDGFDVEIIGDVQEGFTVTNTEIVPPFPLIPGKTKVSVEKVWEGEAQDEVTINLLADGEEVDTIILSEANDWKHTFKDLPVVNDVTDETVIVYTIEEVEIEGFNVEITGDARDGFTVTNTELTNILVEKVWEGKAQDEVTVNLLADGEEVGTIDLSEDNDWQHVFENLPVANGEESIVYTVEEVEIDGYDTSITGNVEDGFTVTNIELIDIPVEKVWKLYEKEKENVTIILLADNEGIDSVELSEENDWKYVFEDLPVANGSESIVYTIKEIEVEGFDVAITGDVKDGFTVTNTENVPPYPILPGKTKVDVEKVWDGEAQESVTINLLADGEKIDSIELSADNEWKHTFKGLPTVHNVTDENVIVYTVEEVEIDGYETTITGNKQDGFVVTNTLNPPETPNVEKEVEDNNGGYGKELVEKELEKEFNYCVNTDVPDNLLGYEYITLADELDERLNVISAVALVDGEEIDYEVSIDGQLVTLKVDREQLDEIAGQELTLQITAQIKPGVEVEVIDNEATIQVNDNPSEKSNKVPVIPPPEIEKDIDGEKAVEPVEKLRGQEYEYNVMTTLPEDVSGFKIVTISDDLDERLSVINAKVLVDGEASDVKVNIDGQLVTVHLENGQIEPLAGKEIKLVITAKINADVEVEVIDNQASIQVNDNPKVDSNKVPVIPPTTPDISKDVEGSDHLDIDFDKEYNYNIITALPSNIEDYEKFVISDKVDKGLIVNADKVTATVDGEAYDGLELTVDGNDVKVEVTDFVGLKGKGQIELVITAKVHPDTNIDDYKDNKIPNTADLDFTNESGDDSKITTDPVTVTPPPVDPPTTPEISKDVEGKDHLDIDFNQEYEYNIITTLPSNIEDYEKFVITDKVDQGLVVNADKVTTTVDGEAYDGLELTVNGNDVKVEVTDFAGLAGKGQIELVITAAVHPDTNIDDYKDNLIPNTADLDFINESGEEDKITTDPVTVTPPPVDPPTTPEISKDVEGKDHLDIDYNQEYKYNIITILPNNIKDYKKFVITDKVDKGLVVNADKVTATVDGETYDGLELTVDGNDVKVEVTDFAGLAGKGQIELVITAKIHPDTNIDDYKNNQIPNTADLDFINESGDEDKITTDPVTVTPPPVDPPTTPKDLNEDEPAVGVEPVDQKIDGSGGSNLPSTATNIYNLALIGFGLMLLGLLLFIIRRKRIE